MVKINKKSRLILILSSGVLVIWFNKLGILAPIKTVSGIILSPISRLFGNAGSGVGSFFQMATSIRNLNQDNAKLSLEVLELRKRLSEDIELRQQNEALRRQLNFGSSKSQQLVASQVIAYSSDNFRQSLIINKGTLDGVHDGMAVVSEGLLVGKIVESNLKTAKVFLAIDPSFKVNGIDQETRASGTVHGQIGTGLTIDKIAQNDAINPGDTIITTGLGGEIPRGLIIGKVESVQDKDIAVFKSAQITTSLRYNKLELIFVLVSP